MRPRRLVPRMHDDRERQPELRDAQRVVAVRRASGLLRVVAELRPLLAPVDRLHRRVEVEDVVLRHHVLQEMQVLPPDPRKCLALGDGREVSPHGVARHEPPDAEQLRRRRVAVEAVEVPEPRRAVDHRHHHRGDQVAHVGRVVARQPHRARLDKAVEEASGLRELAQQRGVRVHAHLRLVVPPEGVVAPERRDCPRTCGLFCAILSHVVRRSFLVWSLKV